MYLVTTTLQEFWPDGGPVWLLSSACCPDPDSGLCDRWQVLGTVSNPFEGKAGMEAGYAENWRVAEQLIGLMGERLNELHGTAHSPRYWRSLIGFWAMFFVSVVNDRHARLLRAKSEVEGIEIIGCRDAPPAASIDTFDFACEAADDLYNSQLYTYLAEKLDIPVAEYRAAKSSSMAEKTLPYRPSRVKGAVVGAWNRGFAMLADLFAPRAHVLMVASYLPRWFELALSLATRGRVYPLYTKRESIGVSLHTPVDPEIRARLGKVPPGWEGLPALVVELAGKCMPKSFVEDYRAICRRAGELYKGYRPRAIYSANSWYYDDIFKHWAGSCQEQGSKLIGSPHGGAAFIQRHGQNVALEMEMTDYYLTWGWSDPANPKLCAVPACKLIGLSRRTGRKPGQGVLYMGTAMERHSVSGLMDFSSYPEWQRRFFAHLPPAMLGEFLVRQHFMNLGWNLKERLARAFPALRFDDWQVGFRDRLDQCRVFVCDHLSTTFAEALAANVPTVLFWNPSTHPTSDFAQPYLQPLRDCHILHDTPESAAAWVAEVYEDVESWWFGASCQKALKDFCFLFARTSDHPLREWKSTLERLALTDG